MRLIIDLVLDLPSMSLFQTFQNSKKKKKKISKASHDKERLKEKGKKEVIPEQICNEISHKTKRNQQWNGKAMGEAEGLWKINDDLTPDKTPFSWSHHQGWFHSQSL